MNGKANGNFNSSNPRVRDGHRRLSGVNKVENRDVPESSNRVVHDGQGQRAEVQLRRELNAAIRVGIF